jgi:hypothetical protein
MKYLTMICLTILLGGCGWFGGNTQNGGSSNNGGNMPNGNNSNLPDGNSNGNNNGSQSGNNQQEPVKTSTMNDLFGYFNDQGLTIANAKDISVVDMNAHEGRMFEYENNPVYVYRMNLQDSNIKSWMEEAKNTGKVTINQDGKEETYDAMINGEYMMVTKSGTNLNKLSEAFKKYEIK